MFRTKTLFILALLAPISWASGVTPAFTAAQALFEQALAGDEDQTEAALSQMTALTEQHPGHPVFLAYQGSAYTLKGRDGWWPWTRIANTEKGLAMIDKALSQLDTPHSATPLRGVPISVETRLVAASTYFAVPDFMHRLESAKQTLSALLADPEFSNAPAPLQARIHNLAAKAAQQQEDPQQEAKHQQHVIDLDPNSPYAQEAQNRLIELAR